MVVMKEYGNAKLGRFYLQGTPGDGVFGLLSFDRARGGLLEVAAPSGRLLEPTDNGVGLCILGEASASNEMPTASYLLPDCTCISVRPAPEVFQTRYVLRGIDVRQQPLFTSATMRFANMETWVNWRPPHPGSGHQVLRRDRYEDKAMSTIVEVLVTVGYSSSFHAYPQAQSIGQIAHIQIRFTEAVHFDQVMNCVNTIQDLLTVAIGYPSRLLELTLEQEGTGYPPQQVHAYCLDRVDAAMTDHTFIPHNMMLDYHALGKAETIARWIDMTMFSPTKTAIERLMQHRYRWSTYAYDEFNALIAGIEALGRVYLDREGNTNNSSQGATQRRFNAVVRNSPTIHFLVGNGKRVNKWQNEVIGKRTEILHGELVEPDYLRTSMLSKSLRYILLSGILQECSVPQAAFNELADHWDFQDVKSCL